jgi:hypothetical protein
MKFLIFIIMFISIPSYAEVYHCVTRSTWLLIGVKFVKLDTDRLTAEITNQEGTFQGKITSTRKYLNGKKINLYFENTNPSKGAQDSEYIFFTWNNKYRIAGAHYIFQDGDKIIDTFQENHEIECSQIDDYEKELIGIWAMDPILVPTELAGIANVTEYKKDGSYQLYNFKCIGNGKFTRDESQDSVGRWRLDGNNIITRPENSEELNKLKNVADELRAKIDSLPPEKKELVRKSLPKEMADSIDGGQIENREHIISINANIMKSKQDLGLGKVLYFNNKKVTDLKPSCEKF